MRYLFIYGSLLSRRSREATLQGEVDVTPATLRGFRRVWNMHTPQLGGGITFLGLEPFPEATCWGAVMPVHDDQFDRLAAREQDYELTPLNWTDIEEGPADREEPLHAFTYVSSDRPNDAFPIVQSYLDVCLTGCLELGKDATTGENHCASFLRDTAGWGPHWVNDRVHARRPFVEFPQSISIDQAIRNCLPELVGSIRIPG